jgi:hypothetical protein
MKDQLSESLTQLERELRLLIEAHQAPELLRHIASCQTNLQYELEKIAQWFTISGSNLVPQFSIHELVNICVQSINNIYPHKKVDPAVGVTSEVTIDGKYFSHFSDIVRTLLDNIIVHAGIPSEQMGVEIDATTENERLEVSLKNNLSDSVRALDPVDRLNCVQANLDFANISEVIAREGGSGLLKVRKIMTVDLHRNDPSLRFSYSDEGKFVVTLSMELEGLTHENLADRG